MIDPELAALFAVEPAITERPSLSQMRDRSLERATTLRAKLGDRFVPARTLDLTVAGLPARAYWPPSADGSALEGPMPTVVYLHGGGWVMGNRDSHAAPAQRLCVEGGFVVVAVDYRLAPEHVFPTAFDDCVAAIKEVAGRLDEFGGAQLAVAGASAGGQLAASAVMALRALPDEGVEVAAALVSFPTSDARGGYLDAINTRYHSRITRGIGYGLTLTELNWFVQQYLPDERDWADWRASPLFADVSKMPPTALHTAGYDPLADEGNALARAIQATGVVTIHREFESLTHSYINYAGVSPAADRAATLATTDLLELLALAQNAGSAE